MSDALTSQIHASLETTQVTAAVDDHWAEGNDRKCVLESTDTSGAPATIQTRFPASESSALRRRTARGEKGVRIAIQSKGRVMLFDASTLIAVEAQGNYVLLQLQTCSHLFRKSISKVEEILVLYGFVRVHRSVVVNSAHVEEIQSSPTGAYRVRMRSGKTYSVGRLYTTNLRLLAEAWIDTES